MAIHRHKNSIRAGGGKSSPRGKWWKSLFGNHFSHRSPNIMSRVNRATWYVLGYTTDNNNITSPASSIKQYIIDNWRPLRRLKHQRYTTNDVPSLTQMPADIIGHVFDYLAKDASNVTAFLALQQTCRSFNSLLGKDQIWETLYPLESAKEFEHHRTTPRESVLICRALSTIRWWQMDTNNILLDYMSGADGLRRVITYILERTDGVESNFSSHVPFVRGDSIQYLADAVQDHIITKLDGINAVVIQNMSTCDMYPEIQKRDLENRSPWTPGHFQHCSVVNGYHSCFRYYGESGNSSAWQDSFCFNNEQIINAEDMQRVARVLAYRAGVVKITGEALSVVAVEVIHHLTTLTFAAFEACKEEASIALAGEDLDSGEDSDSDDEDEGILARKLWYSNNYFANHCPPFQTDADGKVKCVIIPRQIKEAAMRNGMKPPIGQGLFGNEWAPSEYKTIEEYHERTEEEVQEAIAQYELDDNYYAGENNNDFDEGSFDGSDLDEDLYDEPDEEFSDGDDDQSIESSTTH